MIFASMAIRDSYQVLRCRLAAYWWPPSDREWFGTVWGLWSSGGEKNEGALVMGQIQYNWVVSVEEVGISNIVGTPRCGKKIEMQGGPFSMGNFGGNG